MKIKKIQNQIILFLLLFILVGFSSIIPIFKDNTFDNYLFNGKEYDMTLEDVYDDENYTKLYTGANFSYVFMENESTTFNEVVSPVNNSEFNNPNLADYPATYSFENEVGETGTDIDFVDSEDIITNGGEVEVLSNYDGHNEVLYAKTSNNWRCIRDYFDPQVDGYIEFWTQFIGGSSYTITIVGDTGTAGYIIITATYIRALYGDGEGGYLYTDYYNNDFTKLTRIKVLMKTSTDTYSLWMNGELQFSDIPFIYDATPTSFSNIRFYLSYSSVDTEVVWDAIGYSWDSGYTPSKHHAGTYSFTDDIIGSNPLGWTVSETNGEISVVAEKEGHKKCVYLHETSGAGIVEMQDNFDSNQDDETIEFWWYSTTTGWLEQVHFNNDVDGNLGYLYANDNNLYWYDFTDATLVGSNTINQWNRVVVYFNGNDVDISVNEATPVSVIFKAGKSTLDYIRIRAYKDGEYWVDAIGYSWDEHYTIGDNLNPSFGNVMPEGLEMIDGTYDYSNNMTSNDDFNSEFTSTTAVTQDTIYISSVSMHYGSKSGTIANAQNDDSSYFTLSSEWISGAGAYYVQTDNLGFSIDPAGRDMYISYDIWSSSPTAKIKINGANWKSGSPSLDADDQYHAGVNDAIIWAGGSSSFTLRVYYFKMVEDSIPVDAELNYTIDVNFNEVDTSKLLALDVSSYHYTNISQTIIGKIYNYDSGSYTQMFSSSNTVETENYFMDNVSVSDYLNPSGNLRLYFTGFNSTSSFKQIIDYIRVRFYYKMDLSHSITFETNGLWKYRWILFGSIQYTDWTFFEVVDPPPNFYAISESDITTRWILQDSSLSPVEDFHDDINTNAWDITDITNRYINITKTSPTDDTYCDFDNPDTNYGSDLLLYSINFPTTTLYKRTFIDFDLSSWTYLLTNQSNDYRLGVYLDDGLSTHTLYNTSGGFNEHAITWNTGMPDIDFGNAIDSIEFGPDDVGWFYFDSDGLYDGNFAIYGEAGGVGAQFRSKEYSNYAPKFIAGISKNYFGDGYMYMQTGTTELISLKSPDYGTHKTLSSGDYFEVDFQTNSDSQINLILLKDGEVNKTLTLSQSGNTNFNRHAAKISVPSGVEFDQLKISSTLEGKDNVKVYDIKTFKYTLTGDSADFFVGPNRDYEVYLTPNTYNLRITEEGDEKVNTNITIPTSGVLQHVYTPIERLECRIALFNTIGESLEFTDYHIKVNRSLNGIYNEFSLLDSIFSADKETYAYISIYDRFDTLIDTFERLTSDYIDLELEVYQLQIKNLMVQKTTLDINSSYTYPLLSGDSIYFMLSKEYYKIGYYDSDNDYHQFSIYLDSNQAYELNHSKICFLSYADQQGNHLSFENYKTYINGSLIYENIFYEDAGDDVNITITDRYDYEVYQDIYSVDSGDNYIPITLTMYSLKVMNQQENFNHINITRDPNYYESEYFWSEWIAPGEIIDFKLFAGHYVINLSDEENSGSSEYGYELSGDDFLLISSGNTIYNVLYNLANVNSTIGNQITYICVNLTNQNSEINNSIVFLTVNIESLNSSLGSLLVDMDFSLSNIANNISSLYVFTNNSFINLDNQINSSFIYMENNIISINQSISTLVIGIDNSISILNGTVTTMFTEMNQQFIVTQTSIDFSFTSLNQSLVQLANNISTNQVVLYNLIEQRANDIDDNLINIQTLINLLNSTVANESLVVQTLINLIGNNITENHVIINNLINQLGNNITENNLQLVSILEVIGNNITSNHFVIQTLLDVIGNNITENHFELLTNLNLINSTIGVNQIELINSILLVNSTITDLVLELTNQILFVNDTIYTAVLDLSTSVEFGVDVILGNITLTYEQNEFLTELYKETMFSSLLNWSDVAYNYSLMEDRIDAWEFINNYKNQSITVLLSYNEMIDNLTVSAQNTIEQYLPNEGVEYRLWSITDEEYLTEWQELPANRTVDFGFYNETISGTPDWYAPNIILMIVLIIMGGVAVIGLVGYIAYKYWKKNENYRKSYVRKVSYESEKLKKFSQGNRIK